VIVALGETVTAVAAEIPVETAVEDHHPMDHRPLVQKQPQAATPFRNGKQRVRISPLAKRRAVELQIETSGLQGSGPEGAVTLEDVEMAAAAKQIQPRVHITPVARRMAEDLGVDINLIQGSGPNGSITKEDIEMAAQKIEKPKVEEVKVVEASTPEPPSTAVIPPPKPAMKKSTADIQAGMRRAIAAAMAKSNREIPHYYLETRIDMTPALSWLEAENQKRSIKERILPAVLMIKATAKALVDVPVLNAYWRDDENQIQEGIHIGFAIALRQGGLVTPAIHHADLKSLDELMTAMRDLIMRTRAGRLRSSELTDATVTLTNLGDMGVEKVYGVIYPPQVALVGFGKTMEMPWAENGMLGIRKIVTATLAGDHRATDGRTGAQFLDALNKHLREAEKL
jgi:pyruvate dehydrogenase E2 component (dihydrolipoamide acetyltransferase)